MDGVVPSTWLPPGAPAKDKQGDAGGDWHWVSWLMLSWGGLKVLWPQEVLPGIAVGGTDSPAGLVSLLLWSEWKLQVDVSSQTPHA